VSAALWYLVTVVRESLGTDHDAESLVLALKLSGLSLLGFAFLWVRPRWSSETAQRLRAFADSHYRLLVGLCVLAAGLVAWATTPTIEFGNGAAGTGYGHDGIHYGYVAETFNWSTAHAQAPFNARWLAPMLVHASRLDLFTGFHVLNLLCFALSCLLVAAIPRDLGHSRPIALVAVAAFVCLKPALKYWVFVPITVDAPGVLLGLLAVHATLRGRHWLYVLAMLAAVFTRENLLVLAPFHVLYAIRTGPTRRAWILSVGLQVLPVAALVLSRLYPPVAPDGTWDPWDDLALWSERFFFVAAPGRQQMFVLASINALGILAILPVLQLRSTVGFLWRSYEWLYLAAASLLLSAVVGADYDRFAMWSLPVVIVLLAESGALARIGGKAILFLLAGHLVASELLFPWASTEHFMLTRFAAHPVDESFRQMSIACWAIAAYTVLVWARARAAGAAEQAQKK